MSSAAPSTIEYDYALLSPGLSRIGDGGVVSLEPLRGGRNARVYRLECAGGGSYVAKIYPEGADDSRDERRGREFAALRFMWRHGIRAIPEPVLTDPGGGYSVLRYVEGFPLSRDGIVEADIDVAVDFLVELDRCKHEPASRALGHASEACLSVEAAFEHLRRRLGGLRLAADPVISPVHARLREFLEAELEPGVDSMIERAQDLMALRGETCGATLGERTATLSPSDFGFHNARRSLDGSIAFLDFEHFGWDDPAKLVSDFLLHPGFDLDDAFRARFFGEMCSRHSCGDDIAWRVPIVFPLHALKWSTILLNEFVAEHRARRDHARCLLGPDESLLEDQLDQARQMLETGIASVQRFPHAAESRS
ncbi:MAG: phosphotransferase [Myxococcota bacterium]|jgi:hypothetical protein|nr:phosphotransferase [Myxococcota bacterium]